MYPESDHPSPLPLPPLVQATGISLQQPPNGSPLPASVPASLFQCGQIIAQSCANTLMVPTQR